MNAATLNSVAPLSGVAQKWLRWRQVHKIFAAAPADKSAPAKSMTLRVERNTHFAFCCTID